MGGPDDIDDTPSTFLPTSTAWHPLRSADDRPLTVVLAADSSLIGDGLRALLAGRDEVTVTGEAFESVQLASVIDKTNPDVLILWLFALRRGVVFSR